MARRGSEMDRYRQMRWLRFVPLALGLLGLPMVLGLVPPNPIYGLRTAATLASETVWYSANFWSGLISLILGTAATVGNVLLDRATSRSPGQKLWMMLASLLIVAIAPPLIALAMT